MPTSYRGVDTIEEVLEALDSVIARALEEASLAGYFAAIYRKVTAEIAETRRPVPRRRRADAAPT